jgi:hypothetical protein
VQLCIDCCSRWTFSEGDYIMRRILLCVGVASLFVALGFGLKLGADDKPKSPDLEKAPLVQKEDKSDEKPKEFVPRLDPKSPLAKFMHKKLEASNLILEGLVTENFGNISKGAKQLEEMSSVEQWRVSNDALYRQMSGEFRRIAQQLQKDSKQATVDAAALTWIKATMTCIECHKYTKGMLISGE